jgi:hypothetical protein
LAKQIEKRLVGVYATTLLRDSQTNAAVVEEGMFAYVKAADPQGRHFYYYSGSAWVAFPPLNPSITSGTSVPSNATGANGDIYFKV